jgi:magnesium-transporting ATPase (P-type)
VIASDKTGTLTVNQQTAKIIALPNGQKYQVSGTGYELKGKVTGAALHYAEEIGLLGVLNNEANIDDGQLIGDSVDIAFLVLGKKLGVKTDGIKILETIPYESENKYSAVFYEKDGEVYCTAKGSLEVIESFSHEINFSHGKSKDFANLNKQNDDMARDGYRVIALANGKIARKDHYDQKDIKNLTFMGMVGFIDPIRKEVVASINECHAAGIKVLMVTGDHPLTAFKIGRDLKLVDDYAKVATSAEVEEAFARGEDDFDKFVSEHIIYARVTPIQKLNIVNSLKRQGEFVAVTGDGVNDAPALKTANIGVAMGSGTDIARETADMIIVDDNFKSIVAGIKEGRVAYSNIRKIIFFLISCGIAEAIFFCLAIVCDMPMPLVAVQLLWLNVVTDGIQDFAMSFEKAEKGILTEKPRNPKESIFNKSLIREILVSAGVIAAVVFAAWWFFLDVLHMDVVMARSYTMCLMVFIQNVHVFNCRSEKRSAFTVSITKNPIMLFGIAGTILLQIIVMEVPFFSKILQTDSIPPLQILGLFGVSLIILVVMELYKQISAAILARKKQ